jgi:hypothetical protein
MSTEVPNYKDATESAHRIETIAAMQGGTAALTALEKLAADAKTAKANNTDGPTQQQIAGIVDQLSKDDGGKYLSDISAAWVHKNENRIHRGQPVSGDDIADKLDSLGFGGSPDPLVQKYLETAKSQYEAVTKAAGKKPGEGLSDADLAKAQATLDKEIHGDFKHQIVDQADASKLDGPAVAQALTADGWKLFNRIATISDLGKSSGQIQMKNLDDFVSYAKNNPSLFDKQDVEVAKYLQANFDKFKTHESYTFGHKDYIDFNSLGRGLGIASDKPGDIMIKLLQEK